MIQDCAPVYYLQSYWQFSETSRPSIANLEWKDCSHHLWSTLKSWEICTVIFSGFRLCILFVSIEHLHLCIFIKNQTSSEDYNCYYSMLLLVINNIKYYCTAWNVWNINFLVGGRHHRSTFLNILLYLFVEIYWSKLYYLQFVNMRLWFVVLFFPSTTHALNTIINSLVSIVIFEYFVSSSC